MKKLITVLCMLTLLSAYPQSYHTITIDGNNDFNTASEKLVTTSGTASSAYLTWDKDFIYVGLSGNSPAGSLTDNDRVYILYIDTDPQKIPTDGTGSTVGLPWRFTPTLPFKANYRYAFKTADNTEFKSVYSGGSWTPTDFLTVNFKSAGYWEIKIKRSDIGNPQQINVIGYVVEDWSGGSVSTGFPSGAFTNGTITGDITFNNQWINTYLIDQITPNKSYNLNNYQWMLRLNASTSTLSDTTSWAGMGINATNGLDNGIDLENPPLPPSNYLEVYFPHTDWVDVLGPNYSRDIRQIVSLDSTTSLWGFSVNTDKTNTNVTLSANNYSSLPSNYMVKLYDISRDSTHDLKSSSYTYNTGSSAGAKNFNLIIGVALTEPDINVTPSTLSFGNKKINSDTTISLQVSNLGQSQLNITNIVSSNAAFTFTGGTTYSITSGSSVNIPVKFRPTQPVVYNATLTFTSNDPDEGTLAVNMSGTGLNRFPEISVNNPSYNFGDVKIAFDSSFTFKIYNTGDTTLVVSSIASTNSAFTFSGATSYSIQKNDSVSLSVKFKPAVTGAINGNLVILSNDEDEDTLTVALTGTGITSTLTKKFYPGWNLMSIPVKPDVPTPNAVIGDDASTYFLYNYNSVGGYFAEDTIKTGEGYYLGIMDTVNLDVTGTPVVTNQTMDIKAGWNITATPFIKSYKKNAVYFTRNNRTVKADSAVILGWIQNNYYTTSGGSIVSKDTLETWKGYWFAALTDSLKMSFYYDSTSGSPLNNSMLKENSINDWSVEILAQVNNSKDNLLSFGVNQNASDEFDAVFDNAKPPISPDPTSVYSFFEHSTWSPLFTRYASDIKQSYTFPQSGKTWVFKVQSAVGGSLKLSWMNILQQIPVEIREKYNFTISGGSIVNPINMLTTSEYQFTAAAGEVYTFAINSTLTGVEDDLTKGMTFNLNQNYPNPFNPSTVINYSVPAAGLVTLKVYDILGREVKELVNEFKNAGNFSVEFNASTLSSGSYFYKLSSGDKVQVKKMTLIK